jgi:hypothetical protein
MGDLYHSTAYADRHEMALWELIHQTWENI